MKPTLTVRRLNGCYAADYSECPDAKDIQDLFGTTIIPTAYLGNANPELVRARIQELNPEYHVIVKIIN